MKQVTAFGRHSGIVIWQEKLVYFQTAVAIHLC